MIRGRGRGRAHERGAWRRILLLVATACTLSGCLSRPAVVTHDLLEPVAIPMAWLPTQADLDAAALARIALISHPPEPRRIGQTEMRADARVERALDRLERSSGETGQHKLLPLGIDLRNATLDDPIADRAAARRLRKRRDVDPRLESRLDRMIADDPIHLARRRILDDWHRLWARTFNAVAEPIGNSVITGLVIAPFQLANSIIHYFADFSNAEPLSLRGRQALSLRKQFLAAHPDTEWTEALERKVEAGQIRLERTLALRRVRAADRASDADHPRLAARHAAAALSVLEAHPEENGRLRRRAGRAILEADEEIGRRERLDARSSAARLASSALREIETRIASELLADGSRFETLEPMFDEYSALGGDAGRAEFVRAMLQAEQGFEAGGRSRLSRLARRPSSDSTMARHAQALLGNDWQNPYGAFQRLKRSGRREELAWRLAGEWVNRPRYPNLPTPVAYLIDTPTIAMTIILAPLRALISPWTGTPDFQRGASLAAYRYLRRHPDGEEQRDVLEWLYDYETGREHWGQALRLADIMPEFDADERAKLVEKTAESRVANLDRLDRRDTRWSLLRGVAKDFPDSEQGRAAGLQVRDEYEDASPQHIRISRDFLLENPEVAGRSGVGLNPRLLNDDPGDGELHAEGVVLRGGRMLEIRLIAEGGDDDDPPESVTRRISAERLTRIAASLDEAVQRNGLIDVDARFAADANRDVYLERAGLGVTEDVDSRPTAESSFVYQSLRERYGMVRGRDSVLPFDLVFRGSLNTLSLGAFPRWRTPPDTPDAFLYR
ncbi:MAG: hypothetical protein JRG86_14255 [Deltaproteobacteria bacterium]|jgi:hypothetical protein|nr:hypothetical protein [Deltaproteobacteria bacterium]MBW2500929.1 hypothetical protein [Deltaproteobacteria bacterium]